ncbi:FMN-binding negative transcriptional regulator [Noviherbaspirillum sp. UKPF54]|uniref:FMN-binding negative transcriptional regulator n=1 Tax=Noviherbaspirillum sp. UKPF54 TaxID=2601898 RepID=UPI0011B1AF3C|nr:FMN-binding negative transcriptional regulator [Noviherbaspirillum sp. UKPF54]QDZ27281.1 FMN-binding negative transcriptional regulator [Noviherbaspirillum sp. UKPF54]
MYLPKHFEETDTEQLYRLMRAHPLGTLVTLDAGGLNANHIPFEIDPGAGRFGTLRAHVARNNPVWRDASADLESLAVFQGPQAYISPSLYATKQEGGKVVPTYNFMVVHAYGRLRAVDDPAWLRAHLARMSDSFEAARPEPWKLSDAPDDFIEKLLAAVVGIEIPIDRLIGKWKLSQNQPLANRVSVEQGLRAAGDAGSLAMADAVANASR